MLLSRRLRVHARHLVGRVIRGDLSVSRSTPGQDDPHEMAPVKTTPRQLSSGESSFRSNRQAQCLLKPYNSALGFYGDWYLCACTWQRHSPSIVRCDYNLQAQLKPRFAL